MSGGLVQAEVSLCEAGWDIIGERTETAVPLSRLGRLLRDCHLMSFVSQCPAQLSNLQTVKGTYLATTDTSGSGLGDYLYRMSSLGQFTSAKALSNSATSTPRTSHSSGRFSHAWAGTCLSP